MTTTGATFQIAAVKLEPGPLATSFLPILYKDELARCQRYFYLIPGGGLYPAGGPAAAPVMFLPGSPVQMRLAGPTTAMTNLAAGQYNNPPGTNQWCYVQAGVAFIANPGAGLSNSVQGNFWDVVVVASTGSAGFAAIPNVVQFGAGTQVSLDAEF
jgi:hypothetical protein